MKRNRKFDINEFQQQWVCPITYEPMSDPVSTQDGHSYQRKDIMQWLKKKKTSPKTNKQLNSLNLIQNRVLKNVIQKYKNQLKYQYQKLLQQNKQLEQNQLKYEQKIKQNKTQSVKLQILYKDIKTKLQKQNYDLNNKFNQLNNQFNELNYKLQKEKIQLKIIYQKQKTQLKNKSQQEYNQLKTKYSQLLNNSKRIGDSFLQNKRELQKFKLQNIQLKAQNNQIKNQLQQLKKNKILEIISQNNKLKLQGQKLKKQNQFYTAQNQSLIQQKIQNTNVTNNLKKQSQVFKRQNEVLKRDNQTLKNENIKYNKNNFQLNRQIQSLNMKINEQAKKIQEYEKAKNIYLSAKNTYQNSQKLLQQQKKGINSQMKQYKQKEDKWKRELQKSKLELVNIQKQYNKLKNDYQLVRQWYMICKNRIQQRNKQNNVIPLFSRITNNQKVRKQLIIDLDKDQKLSLLYSQLQSIQQPLLDKSDIFLNKKISLQPNFTILKPVPIQMKNESYKSATQSFYYQNNKNQLNKYQKQKHNLIQQKYIKQYLPYRDYLFDHPVIYHQDQARLEHRNYPITIQIFLNYDWSSLHTLDLSLFLIIKGGTQLDDKGFQMLINSAPHFQNLVNLWLCIYFVIQVIDNLMKGITEQLMYQEDYKSSVN